MNKWYQQTGKQQDMVLSSRIRLARNLKKYPFALKLTADHRKQLNEEVVQALSTLNLGENSLQTVQMDQLSEVERYSLVERHVISPEFAKYPQDRWLLLSNDESISIMIGEEDHLRMQVLSSGLDLQQAYALCDQIDTALDQMVEYAFDEKHGYLTACPSNLGTGMRASVMMHLPALERSGLIASLTSTIGKLGLTIRGMYGEGSHPLGALYQISNQITLGITEADSIQNLESVVLQIMLSEQNAREMLLQHRVELEDSTWRSFGVLRHARLLTSKEFYEHYSNLRMGVSLGIISEISEQTLVELLLFAGSASVCVQAGQMLHAKGRDQKRAEWVRQKLQTA